jgi:HAD superfamily hydrolase (TIGR01493 family)
VARSQQKKPKLSAQVVEDEDFRWVTSRALEYALAFIDVQLPAERTQQLIELYDHLRPFPDAAQALGSLVGMGYELAVLSNGSPDMIKNCLEHSGLADYFGQRISADEVRAFKPAPTVYRHAAERLGRPSARNRIPHPPQELQETGLPKGSWGECWQSRRRTLRGQSPTQTSRVGCASRTHRTGRGEGAFGLRPPAASKRA